MAPRSENKTTLQVSSLEQPQPKPQHSLILPKMQPTKPRIKDHRGSTCLLGSRAEFYLLPGDHNGPQIEPTRAFNGGWTALRPCTTQVGHNNTSSNPQGLNKHRYRRISRAYIGSRCSRSKWTTLVLGSNEALAQGNLFWGPTTSLPCQRGHQGITR